MHASRTRAAEDRLQAGGRAAERPSTVEHLLAELQQQRCTVLHGDVEFSSHYASVRIWVVSRQSTYFGSDFRKTPTTAHTPVCVVQLGLEAASLLMMGAQGLRYSFEG